MFSRLPPLCIIGTPVHHSLSPLLHTTVLRSLGIPWTYEAVEVLPAHLADFVAAVRTGTTFGFNVTIPHKEAIIPFLDEIDDAAKRIGAVNTVVVKNKKLRGYNTDVVGVEESLAGLRDRISNRPALVIGSGGAARAIAYTLVHTLHAERLVIASRNKEKTDKLVRDLTIDNARWMSWDAFASLERADEPLVVNTTPIGMVPNINDSPINSRFTFTPQHLAFDAIYRPAKTKFLADAERQGAFVLNGLPMLLHQAAAAFRLWTGKSMPMDLAEATLIQALSTRA